jgi:energy-coupling factor transporter ATP-binding protein EcfA2
MLTIYQRLRGMVEEPESNVFADFRSYALDTIDAQERNAIEQKAQAERDAIEQKAQAERDAIEQIAAREANDNAFFDQLNKQIGRPILQSEHANFRKAVSLLKAGNFLEYVGSVIGDYYTGEPNLVRLILVSALRVGFVNPAVGLLHYKLGGATGSGKSSLYDAVAAVMPPKRVVILNSITPAELYYEAKDNPDRFKGKLVVVNEAADMRSTMSIKGLSEGSDTKEIIHRVTGKGDFVIKGPRMLLLASVNVLKDSQTANRFVQLELKPETDQAKVDKAKLQVVNGFGGFAIETDTRTPVCRCGFEVLLNDSKPFKVVDGVVDRAEELASEIALGGVEARTRRVRQFISLAFCIAASQAYARGGRQVLPGDCDEARKLLGKWI